MRRRKLAGKFWQGDVKTAAAAPTNWSKGPAGARDHEEYEMKFLISMHINPAVLDALTDEEKAAIGDGHGKFIEALKKSGELITTQALVDLSQAAVVSVRNGQPVVTDGPFLESKEYLGGFYLIDCENKERAIELAAQIPDTAIEGLGVEVRQVMFADGQLEA
ncbi:YciI family protein [Planotetraspora sp. GP83]|uniref:YciI family protein n=1 Tax=Planotetraspora sp. GP83 TaxID=3156264 RepID=UPI003510DF07